MKIFLGTAITLFFSISAIAQSEKGVIRIVQKFYYDTLQANYHKVEFVIDKKADRVKRMDYSSAHNSDTLIIKETTEYKYKEIFNILPADKTPNYSLEGQFLIIDNKEIEDYQELWGVNLFAMDINEFLKKGNLMMTLDDGNGNGNVVYYRLLERID